MRRDPLTGDLNRATAWGTSAVLGALFLLLVAVSTLGGLLQLGALAAALGVLALAMVGPRRLGVAAIFMAFLTAPSYRGLQQIAHSSVVPTDVFLGLGIMLLLPSLAPRRIQLPIPYLVGLVMLGSWTVIGIAASPTISSDFSQMIRWFYYLAFAPIFFAWWGPNTRMIKTLLWAYIAGQVASTLDALAVGPVEAHRYEGLSHHPNAFGMAGALTLAMVCYLWTHYQDIRARGVLAAVAIFGVASVLMSGSRGAVVVVGVLILLVPLAERSALLWVGFAGMAGIGVAMLSVLVKVGGSESALSRLAGTATAGVSDSQRSGYLSQGLQQIADSPIIGHGLLNNLEIIQNIFVEVAVGAGLFGLIGYLLIMFALARPLFTRHPERRLAYMTWVFFVLGLVLPGLWDRTIWVPLSLTIIPALRARPSEGPAPYAPAHVIGHREPVKPAAGLAEVL